MYTWILYMLMFILNSFEKLSFVYVADQLNFNFLSSNLYQSSPFYRQASDLYPSPSHLAVSRLDGSRGAFCRHWGWYDNSGPNSPSLTAGTPGEPPTLFL